MFSEAAKKLIDQLRISDPKIYYSGEELSKIQVDSFVSRIAFIYEKIRNAIDYKEEHLIRKAAIFRILQRRLLIKVAAENLPLSLIKELIRAGYLENNLISASKVEEVGQIVEKYLALLEFSKINRTSKKGHKFFKWLLSLAACEIEECLMPPLANQALVQFMYKVMRPSINLVDKNLSDQEKDLHIYLAAYRALVKSDDAMMDFKLVKYFYPGWKRLNHQEILTIAKKISNLKAALESKKKYYLAENLYRLFKKYAFVFFTLRDIILEDPDGAEQIFGDSKELAYRIQQSCDKSYKKSRAKLRRTVVRVIIYLFLTKMLLALLLEFPYDYYIAKHVSMLPLTINALFPPLLMMFLGLFIKIPSKKNTERVIKVATEVVYQGAVLEAKSGLGVVVKRTNFALTVFYVLYLILFAISFGALIYLLDSLGFNIFSKLIFLLFLSLVSFFGIKLRLKVRELVVIDRKDNFFVFLINLFILPFLKAGHWLSEKFSKINIFVFILDFIIEAPLKIFLEVIEDWIAFLKEKKEEMYSQE